MPYYCLQLTMKMEEPSSEEQLLEYFQDLGISFLEVLCHEKTSDPHFEAMVFGVTLSGGGSTVQSHISIQTSCYVPDEAWLDCTGPLALDTQIIKAELAPQLVTESGQPKGFPSEWMNLPL